MRLLCLPIVLAFASGASNPSPEFSDPARKEKLRKAIPELDEIFAKYQKQRGAPGLIYGLVVDGELMHVKASGVSDLNSKTPVTADTVFRIASMTKSFTALAVLKLRDEGKLSLEDPVTKWIPEFAKTEKAAGDAGPVRVRQLLTHGIGFPEDNPWGDRQLGIEDETLTKWLERGVPLSTTPDTAWEYSNYGFALLGRVVTKASGVPYSQYLKGQILVPLGMTASTIEHSTVPVKLRAIGYRKAGSGFVEDKPLADGAFGPMGGLLVSSTDLAKYVAYQLSAFPARDGKESGPVRRSSQREMQRGWRTIGLNVTRPGLDAVLRANASAYGYGLSISQDCRFKHIVSHGGGLPGFGSYMSWLPEYGVGFFAMTNLTYSGPSSAISEGFDALLKTGGLKPRVLPAADSLLETRDRLVKLWEKWDSSLANNLAADNFFLDMSEERRRSQFESLRGDLGACNAAGDIEPENWLRGKFRMSCEKGFADVFFTLAPTQPPRLQQLGITPAVAPSAEMLKAAELIAGADMDRLGPLLHASLDKVSLGKQMEARRASYGDCKVGKQFAGNGKTSFGIQLDCTKGEGDLQLTFGEDGLLRASTFSRPFEKTCIP